MKIQLPGIATFIVILSCLLIDLDLRLYREQERVIENDIHSYYAYLPAQFIYHDIKLANRDYRFGERYYLCWTIPTEDGKRIIKMTMGLSILYAPFFFVAHAFALLTNYPENGFSEPYKIFLLLSAVFYLLIGLDYLTKILRHYRFSELNIAVTILLIGTGTNLLAYASQSAPMSHVYNFSLFAVFAYYTIKWRESGTIKTTLIIGLLIGLISLIRPSNILILIFFALYGASNFTEMRQRCLHVIRHIILLLELGLIPAYLLFSPNTDRLELIKQRVLQYRKNILLFLLMFSVAFIVWIPQFLYWKLTTGHFICYSYGDREHFFFNDPKLVEGLFGFRKGWLLYTPMMAFALAGLFFMKGDLKKTRPALLVFFAANVYVIFSWWCWWYGGTFGQRSLIDSYPLLAIPFAAFVKFISEKKWYFNALFYCVAAFLIWLNIFQTYQFEYHILHWEGMNKKLYFKEFGKLEKVPDYDQLVDWPNYDEAQKGNR